MVQFAMCLYQTHCTIHLAPSDFYSQIQSISESLNSWLVDVDFKEHYMRGQLPSYTILLIIQITEVMFVLLLLTSNVRNQSPERMGQISGKIYVRSGISLLDWHVF